MDNVVKIIGTAIIALAVVIVFDTVKHSRKGENNG